MKHIKKMKKGIVVFINLLMLVNLFLSPVMMCIDALGSDTLTDYITSMETKITNVEVLIDNTKAESGYNDNKALVNATEYLEAEFNKVKENFVLELTNLDAGISLATLIDNSNDDALKVAFLEYLDLGNVAPTIDKNAIDDVKYLVGGVETTLITKDDIMDLIITYYLVDDNTNINDYVNNYSDKLDELVLKYQNFNTQIDNFMTKITNVEVEILAFEQLEITNGNNPDMIVDEKNIYDLLSTLRASAIELKDNISLEILDQQITSLNTLDVNLSNYVTDFVNNNKTYLELEIDKDILNLNEKYKLLHENINGWFTDKLLSYDYSLIQDKLDVTMINYLKDAIALDDEYQLLLEKINNYLMRKKEHEQELNGLLVDINNYYDYLNKNSILDSIDIIVNNSDLTDEGVIDLLYSFLNVNDLSEDTANKIINAKLAFYTISLIDETNYTWSIIDNKIILKGLKDSILVSDLLTNIDSNATIKVNDDTVVNVNPMLSLELYDSNDKLIVSYQTILQADLNDDGDYSFLDLELMQELLVSKDSLDDFIYMLDINGDNVFSIKDAMFLKEILEQGNNNTPELATEALFNLLRKDEGDKVIYELVLSSDGVVTGFEFNLGVTNDLVFDNMTTNYNILLDDHLKPNKIVGVDEFTNGLVATFTYVKNDNELPQTSAIISNIMIALGYNDYEEIGRVINTVSNIVEEQEVVISTNNNSSVDTSTNTLEDIVIQEEEKEIEKVEEQEEIEEEPVKDENNVVWSNVIKIVIIVLLGASVIYFLNRNEEIMEDDNQPKNKEEK